MPWARSALWEKLGTHPGLPPRPPCVWTRVLPMCCCTSAWLRTFQPPHFLSITPCSHCPQVDFLPDGHYQQDSITLEDQQRRMELFNAAVDSYVAAGVDRRSQAEIECAAKIGLSGGPLYYRWMVAGKRGVGG